VAIGLDPICLTTSKGRARALLQIRVPRAWKNPKRASPDRVTQLNPPFSVRGAAWERHVGAARLRPGQKARRGCGALGLIVQEDWFSVWAPASAGPGVVAAGQQQPPDCEEHRHDTELSRQGRDAFGQDTVVPLFLSA